MNVDLADERLLLAGLASVIVDHIRVLKGMRKFLGEIESMRGLFS